MARFLTNESSLNAPFETSTPARSAGKQILPARRSHMLGGQRRSLASLWLRGSRMHSGSPVSHRRLGITYASFSKKA
jgi:hypothetical protein